MWSRAIPSPWHVYKDELMKLDLQRVSFIEDVRLNHDEGNREERPGRFLVTRAPIGQHVKMFRQVSSPQVM